MKTKFVIAAAVCGSFLVGSSAFGAITLSVVNHSFEAPDIADDNASTVGQVGGPPTGWTGFGSTYQFFPTHPNATYYASNHPGGVLSISGQGIALGGTQGGTAQGGSGLYQTLTDTFVAGQTYTFTLWVGGSYESPGGTQTIGFTTDAVNLDGSLLASNVVNFPNAGDNWVQNSVTYTATAADHGQAIRIILGTTDANGSQTFDLAEVTATPIPEPSSLIFLSLASLGLFARRSRK